MPISIVFQAPCPKIPGLFGHDVSCEIGNLGFGGYTQVCEIQYQGDGETRRKFSVAHVGTSPVRRCLDWLEADADPRSASGPNRSRQPVAGLLRRGPTLT